MKLGVRVIDLNPYIKNTNELVFIIKFDENVMDSSKASNSSQTFLIFQNILIRNEKLGRFKEYFSRIQE